MKIMKRKLIRMALIMVGIVLMGYGLTEGMEWHRLASVMFGGALLGSQSRI